MQYSKFFNFPKFRPLFAPIRFIHQNPNAIVIASAVRTPWGKYQGQLATVGAWQLGQMAVDTAVKQSAVPLDHIQKIYMNEKPQLLNETKQDFVFSDFLKKTKYVPLMVEDKDEPKMYSLLKALEAINFQHHSAVVVGGLESASHKENLAKKNQETLTYNELFPEISSEMIENYINKSLIRYVNSQTQGVFEDEIIPLNVRQQVENRRIIKEINSDEIFPENCRDDNRAFQFSDGAAAFVLTTAAKALEWKLSPLAVIKDFVYLSNSSNILNASRNCVENLINKTNLDLSNIKHWEIEDSLPHLVVHLSEYFNLNWNLVNPNGSSLIVGHSSAASLLRSITHMTHALKSEEYGCVISANSEESLALIIQKLPSLLSTSQLPLLTLYTKDPCPLCDTLVEELEMNFSGEYELQKVFIDTKENLRFLRLYRLDIPVVFLNNQFLCMHRLNHKLLRKKLDLLKELKLK